MKEMLNLQNDIAELINSNKDEMVKSNKPLKITKLLSNIYRTSRFLSGIVNLLDNKYNYTLSFTDSEKNGYSYVTVQAKGLA